jgi:ABC-type transport system involved in cytochrome c biogenesis ATPase subunit
MMRPIPVVRAPEVDGQTRSTAHDDWTVLENVLEPIEAAGATPTLAFQLAVDTLDLLDLKACAGTRFDGLSQSQQDRVTIARTMLTGKPLGGNDLVQALVALQRLTALTP